MRVLLEAPKRKNLTSLFGLIHVDSFLRSAPFYTLSINIFFSYRTKINFRFCSSGFEKIFPNLGLLSLTITIVSLWSLCAWTMDVNLPPWIPPQPTICQRGTKSDVPPIMSADLGNPAVESPPCRSFPSHASHKMLDCPA